MSSVAHSPNERILIGALCVSSVLLVAAAAQVTREDFDTLVRRVERLEADVAELRAAGDAAPPRPGRSVGTGDLDGDGPGHGPAGMATEVTTLSDLSYADVEARFLDSTEAQWDEFRREAVGLRVRWTGQIADVTAGTRTEPTWVEVPVEGKGAAERVFLHSLIDSGADGTFLVVWVRVPGAKSALRGNVFLHGVDREAALALRRGAEIAFVGAVERIRAQASGQPEGVRAEPGVHLTDVRITRP